MPAFVRGSRRRDLACRSRHRTPAQSEFFAQRIQPVLAESCLSCHDSTASGGLRLDRGKVSLKGGESGPAIVVGDPDKSLLLAAVRHTGAIKMPMGGDRISDAKIADLSAWIKDGAVWPDAQRPARSRNRCCSEHFESNIRPVLAQQCFACHTNTKSGGLRLDSMKDMLAGGKSGPAVVPGDPDKSLLIAAIRHSGPLRDAEGRHAAHRGRRSRIS